ncbi:MAG: TonB-dependent receptor [Salinivenus sp.]
MIQFLRSLCIVLLLGLLVGPLPAAAQEEDEDPDPEEEQDESPQLPEIAPREFEIRGDLQIAFPEFERQPLQGFASASSLPSVPTNRTPYVEPYKQELDSLPEQLVSPEPVSAPVQSSAAAPSVGHLEAGTGRYFSRFATGHVSLPLSTREQVTVRADYSGTEGFQPFDESTVETPSDVLDGEVRLVSRRAPVRSSIALEGLIDDYTLYGVAQSPEAFLPDRTFYSGAVTGRLSTSGAVPAAVQVRYGQHQYNTTPAENLDATFRERRLALNGELSVPIDGAEGTVDAAYSRSGLGGDVPDGTESTLDAGTSMEVLRRPSLRVAAGARVLWSRGPAFLFQSQSPTTSSIYALPTARAEWAAAPWATVFAENDPRLEGGSLRSYHSQNPYTESTPSTRPTIYTTDAEAGVDLTRGWVRLQAQAGYRYSPSYRYYVPGVQGFAVQYDAARIVHGGGEIALQGLDPVQAALGVSVRDGALTSQDDEIPYFAPVQAHAMFSVDFADGDATVQTTGTLNSARPTDRTGSEELGSYLAVDVEGSYSVTSTVDVLLRAENVSPGAPEEWLRYPRPPTQITGGFRFRW